MPTQLMATIGICARALFAWIMRLAISLPTPLSPVNRTLASQRAACSISTRSACMAGLTPIKVSMRFTTGRLAVDALI